MDYLPKSFELGIKKALSGWCEIGIKFPIDLAMTTVNTRDIIGEYIKSKYLSHIFTEKELEECICMDYNNGNIYYYLDDDDAERLGLEEYNEDNYYNHPRYELLVDMDSVPKEDDYNNYYEYEKAIDKFYEDVNRISIDKIERELVKLRHTTSYGLFLMLCHSCGLNTDIFTNNEDIFKRYSKRHIIKLQYGEERCSGSTPEIMGTEFSFYDMYVGLSVLNKINDCYS